MFPLDDTIAAIASAPGGAARGIVRLSGPNVLRCLRAVFHSNDKRELQAPMHARAIGGSLELTDINAPVPCDLFFWPRGRSYTGQMTAEFHTLGSPPLLEALLKSLCAAGTRMAERGEFTLRAFLSGRRAGSSGADHVRQEELAGRARRPHRLQLCDGQPRGNRACLRPPGADRWPGCGWWT